MIVIIDYGMGNLRSIEKAFLRVNVKVEISRDPTAIRKADKIILPGVGHFAKGMENLKQRGLHEVLTEIVLEKKVKILGICLGMQLFCNYSEEGGVNGLGWINAKVKKFRREEMNEGFRIPHMGWNSIKVINGSPLFDGLEVDEQFYFVHSYHVVPDDEQDISATTNYGLDFVSVVCRKNIFGVQFHPEKSHSSGLKLLKTFASL